MKSEENCRLAQYHSGSFSQIGKCSCNGVVVQVVSATNMCATMFIFPSCSASERKTNKQCHSSIICQRAHVSCADTYIMRSRCTRNGATPLSQMRPLLNDLQQQTFFFVLFFMHELEHFLEIMKYIPHVHARTNSLDNLVHASWPLKAKLIGGKKSKYFANATENLAICPSLLLLKGYKLSLLNSSYIHTDVQDVMESIKSESQSQSCFLKLPL